MQHTQVRAIRESKQNSALFDAFGLEPNDATEEVDLLDAVSLDALAELCGLRRRIIKGGLPVPPAQGLQQLREFARHLHRANEVGVTRYVCREHSKGLDLVVLGPEG